MVTKPKGGYRPPLPKRAIPTRASAQRFARKYIYTSPRFATVKSKAANIVKEAAGELSITGAMTALGKLEKTMQQPRGANGLALGPTKLEKYSNQSLNSTAVGSSTYSNCFYAYRPQVTLKSPRQRYTQKTSIRTNFSSDENRQYMSDISILDAAPVQNNPDSDSKYTNLSIKKAFDKVLRARMYSGSTAVEQKTSNVTIHLDSVSSEMLITNGSVAAEVTIYDLVPQFDIVGGVYSREDEATGYMSPSWCWKEGLNTETLFLDDTASAANLGLKPTDSVTFSRTWKVIKRTKVRMTQNAVHKHNFVCGINKTIPYQRYASLDPGQGAKYGGFCPTTLLVTRGLPTTTSQGPATNINVSCNLEFKYSSNLNQNTQSVVYDSTT